MLNQPILGILGMHPRGSTNEQLLWRLRNGGVRTEASDLLASLNSLVEGGEIAHRNGRWFARSQIAAQVPGEKNREPSTPPASSAILRAVPATVRSLPPDPAGVPEGEERQDDGPEVEGLPEWAALMAYYAATQRQDPRGRIERFSDQHSAGWQLFDCNGHWWENAEISLLAPLLPNTFREALSRRTTIRSAAIGWPVSVFPTDTGALCVPGLILAATWELSADALTLRVETVQPVLNSAWVREVCRVTVWNETALTDRLFPEGEPDGLGDVAQRMAHALATLGGGILKPANLAPELSLSGGGLRNAAALFLPDDSSFTRGVANDLEAIKGWSLEMRRGTALSALIDGAAGIPFLEVPVLAPGELTDNQAEAAEVALAGPLTAIQGPPGTGKTQVILSLITSAMMSGRSVLFAARNHQALDEVEGRLSEIVPDAPILVRGRDAEGARNTDFLIVLGQIAAGECRTADGEALSKLTSDALVAAGREAGTRRKVARRRLQLNLALSDLTERIADIRQNLPPGEASARLSLFARIRAWLRKLRGRHQADVADPLPDLAPLTKIEQRIVELRRTLSELPGTEAQHESPPDLRAGLRKVASTLALPDEATRAHIAQRLGELGFEPGTASPRRLPPEDARAVLRHRPVWAVSTLSVPARVPLIPALFDYAIFDEASQCDIASALPILARSRSAVIVGDPMQLAFIPGLGRSTEHALMDAAGLSKKGRALLAQSRNSLFDLARVRKGVRRMFLADQFRSSAQIVDYLNSEFYGRRLVGRRADDGFRPPNGYKPGLSWEDVAGQTRREDGGNVNAAEADRIVTLLQGFATDTGFDGNVGVISPFNAQVALIQRRVDVGLPEAARERLKLRVGTVDKWQGGEADVILFSLVLASGAQQSARTFLQKERRRLNVAISRARAICVVVGDLSFAKGCGVRHIERLAQKATEPWSPPRAPFDSLWERRLDTAMRARGLTPFPQYPVGSRYLDFALEPEGAKLDVEVDGRRWHLGPDGQRKTADRLRDRELMARNWKVRRFWVHELESDMEGCLDRIERDLGRG